MKLLLQLPLDCRFEAERARRRRRPVVREKTSLASQAPRYCAQPFMFAHANCGLRISQIYPDLLRPKILFGGKKRGKAGKSGKVWEVEWSIGAME